MIEIQFVYIQLLARLTNRPLIFEYHVSDIWKRWNTIKTYWTAFEWSKMEWEKRKCPPTTSSWSHRFHFRKYANKNGNKRKHLLQAMRSRYKGRTKIFSITKICVLTVREVANLPSPLPIPFFHSAHTRPFTCAISWQSTAIQDPVEHIRDHIREKKNA